MSGVNTRLLHDGLQSLADLAEARAIGSLRIPLGEVVEQIVDDSGFGDRGADEVVFGPGIDADLEGLCDGLLALSEELLFGGETDDATVMRVARRARAILARIEEASRGAD